MDLQALLVTIEITWTVTPAYIGVGLLGTQEYNQKLLEYQLPPDLPRRLRLYPILTIPMGTCT